MIKYFQIHENDFSNAAEYIRKATRAYYTILSVPIICFATVFLVNQEGQQGVLHLSPYLNGGIVVAAIVLWWVVYKKRKQRVKAIDNSSLKTAMVELYRANFDLFIVLAGTFWASVGLYALTLDASMIILFTMAMGTCSFEIPNVTLLCKQLRLKKEKRKILFKGEAL